MVVRVASKKTQSKAKTSQPRQAGRFATIESGKSTKAMNKGKGAAGASPKPPSMPKSTQGSKGGGPKGGGGKGGKGGGKC
jgi:hypothetical protein